MGRLLSFLSAVLLSGAAQAADVWSACPAGQGAAARVLSCYGDGPSAFVGGCPTNEVIAADDLVRLVSDRYPEGSPCGSGSTISGESSTDDPNAYGFYKTCRNAAGTAVGNIGIYAAKVCTEDAACPYELGDQLAAAAFTNVTSGGDTFCALHCQVVIRNFGLILGPVEAEHKPVYYEVTNKICSVIATPPIEPVLAGARYCSTINGQEVCASSGPALIVKINDSRVEEGAGDAVCIDGNCDAANAVATSDNGAQVAPAGTPSPPAPDSGTAGSAASPDLILTSDTSSHSYWSAGTVSGSTTAPGGSTGGSTGGDNGTPGVTCGGPDQAACKVELTGSFAGPEREGAPTFTEAAQRFQSELESAPIITAVSNLAAAIPEGGTPPGGDVTLEALGGVTLTLAPPPEVIAEIAPALSNVMLLVWALVAILILLSA